MTTPDSNTMLMSLINLVLWGYSYYRNRVNNSQKSKQKEGIILKEHRQMYADYKKAHGIKENGV